MTSVMYNYVSFICHTMIHEPLNHIIHFPTITHKMAQISYPYKTEHLLVPSRFIIEYCDTKTHHKTRRHQSRDQNQTSTQSGTAQNSPESSVMTIQKQSRKFSLNYSKTVPKLSPDCPKTIPKISKNSYTQSKNLRTEIYGLSRPLSQSTAIKWPLG